MPATRASRSSASSSTSTPAQASSRTSSANAMPPSSSTNKRVPLASKGSGGKRPLAQRTTQDKASASVSEDASKQDEDKPIAAEPMDVATAAARARNIATLLRHTDDPDQPGLHIATLAAGFAHLVAQNKRSASRRSSVTPAREGDEAGEVDEDSTRVEWYALKNDPERVVQEEEVLQEYFRKLKFIHLELDMKRIFLEDTLGSCEHTKEEVARLEETVIQTKAQMKAAKATVRALRSDIDELCAQLLPSVAPPTPSSSKSRRSAKAAKPSEPGRVAALQADSEEALALLREIGDAELELARLRAGAGAKPMPGTVIPPKGSLTLEEAELWSEQQIEEMQTLETAHSTLLAQVEQRKKDLQDGMRAVERLGVEHNIAETYAAEARKVGVEGTRDLSVEKACTEHKTIESVLRDLVSLKSISAPDSTTLRAVYGYGDLEMEEPEYERAVLTIKYTAPGGRITSYALQREDGADLLAVHAPVGTWSREAFQAAVTANETSGLVQAAMACLVPSA